MPDTPFPAPFVCDRFSVLEEWIDLNGHMNVARYLQAFDQAFDEAYERIGITQEHMDTARGTTFAAEMHITYQRELLLGDPLRITTRLLAYDAKRMHWIQCMYHREKGYLAATDEWLVLYVDIDKRRVGRMPAAMEANFRAVLAAHAALSLPAEVGRRIEFGRRRAASPATPPEGEPPG
jgi:acyl-CoA thioester hydrolase